MEQNYIEPVAKLLTYGNCSDMMEENEEWPDYLQLGLGPEHIPDLIRLATDAKRLIRHFDNLDAWAPVHAWRALGQLKAVEAVEPLLPNFHLSENDWAWDEIPEVFAMIGAPALPVLDLYLPYVKNGDDICYNVSDCVRAIGKQNPEARNQCIGLLTRELERYQEQDPEFTDNLIQLLCDLKASEAMPIIRQVADYMGEDPFNVGDLEDVEILMGLREESILPQSECYYCLVLISHIQWPSNRGAEPAQNKTAIEGENDGANR